MTHKTEAAVYSWQRKGWPRFTFDRAAQRLREGGATAV